MEVVSLAACLNTLLPRLWDNRKDAKKRRAAINIDIEAIGREIPRLEAALEDAKFKGDGTGSAKVTELKRQASELSQKTRDCIQRFFKNKKASCTEFAMNIQDCRKAIEDISSRLEAEHSSGETASTKPQDPYVADPMGMAEPRKELMELVKLPGSRPSEGRPKVISIVGFGGLGKTILAKLVYDHDGTSSLVHRARVTAAAKDADEVLREILKEVPPAGEHENLKLETLNLEKLTHELARRLREKRYLIVIDDMQNEEQWEGMKDAFPKDEDGDGDGTIIVTTTIQSVANVCSSCNGYAYKLSPLDMDKSLDLFLKDRTSWNRGSAENYAKHILEKCDGLPLAIVSMSQKLQGLGGLTSRACEAVCRTLGADLVKEGGGLQRLRWVLMNKYTGLNGYALRCCLLYFCMYKHNMGAVPTMNSLMRRWEAEGFLVQKNPSRRPRYVGDDNLETLIDRNIIQSMEVGMDGATRRCRPPGMMVEYISQISKSENFAALVSDVEEPESNGIRRLSFRAGSAADDRKMSDIDLKIVLTMAVSGNGCGAILNFEKYELIAVLDLKECTNLKKRHVKGICKLLLLKYLSLGDTIGKIPRDIGRLELLETLEMRTSKTVKVYREVLKLPNLKHLLGNFKLRTKPDGRLYNFLEQKSGLETITGFVTKTATRFPELMCHMRQLRKVKVCCDAKANATDKKNLARAIEKFIRGGTDTFSLERVGQDTNSCSLSINFSNDTPKPWAPPLEFLQCPGSLDSLKLRGHWGAFPCPPQFTTITGIKKMRLSRTSKSGKDILASLTNMIALEYLKLEEEKLGPLMIESETFQKLTRLCLVGETSPQGITIQHGALPALVSLHLICKAPIFKVEEPNVRDQISEIEDNHVQLLNRAAPQVEDQISEVEDNEVQLLNRAESLVGDQISKVEDNQVNLLNGTEPQVGDQISEVKDKEVYLLNRVEPRVGDQISKVEDQKVQLLNRAMPQVEDQISEVEDNQVQLLNGAQSQVGDQISKVEDNQVSPLNRTEPQVGDPISEVKGKEVHLLNGVEPRVGDQISKVEDQKVQLLNGVEPHVGDQNSEVEDNQIQLLSGAELQVEDEISEVECKNIRLLNGAEPHVGCQISKLKDKKLQLLNGAEPQVGGLISEVQDKKIQVLKATEPHVVDQISEVEDNQVQLLSGAELQVEDEISEVEYKKVRLLNGAEPHVGCQISKLKDKKIQLLNGVEPQVGGQISEVQDKKIQVLKGTEPHVVDQISEVEDNQVQLVNDAELQFEDQISEIEDTKVQLLNGCLGCLQEIALDSGVYADMHEAWKKAAKGHPNRPIVLLI